MSGMEMMLLNSFQEWDKNGITPEILATKDNIGNAAEALKNAGYIVHHISFENTSINKCNQFRCLLKENRYDIIHIHPESNFFLYTLLSLSVGHKNIVRTFHSLFKIRWIGRVRRHFDRIMARFLGVKFHAISDMVADFEKTQYNTVTEKIYNWYDSNRYLPVKEEDAQKLRKQMGIKAEVFVLCSVGNCSAIKRHDFLLKALAIFNDSVDNWLYLHAGDEQEGFAERKLASSLNIASNCQFLGAVDNVEEILAVSDVFVMSSKLEGLGNAALEAMGMGTPVILTKVPGLNDLLARVPHSEGVDPTPEGIADGLFKVYSMSSSERRLLGMKLQEQVKKDFSMPMGVDKYVRMYRSMILKN
ncbi:glycosyltransferase [Zunongwangia sp. F363]|uniref:Glycosyltransferase n=1 Tax=Autumnicola tepida TaxID=3075595 RepID=A0ABU3C7J3_9FLAO|nr:glycosyltransferase [Zunongwangia sp. F363]MDT0642308.1 glycosyltransferase [Zunongwangia sp. F363]